MDGGGGFPYAPLLVADSDGLHKEGERRKGCLVERFSVGGGLDLWAIILKIYDLP